MQKYGIIWSKFAYYILYTLDMQLCSASDDGDKRDVSRAILRIVKGVSGVHKFQYVFTKTGEGLSAMRFLWHIGLFLGG